MKPFSQKSASVFAGRIPRGISMGESLGLDCGMALLRGFSHFRQAQSGGSGKPRHMVYTGPMYESITRNIRVVVQPRYLQSQSRPDDDHFVWAYTITIENRGVEIVTLRSRHW